MKNLVKQNQLQEIIDFLDKNKSFAFFKFEKTTHTALEGLRKQLSKNSAKIKVIKNTILEKAINKLSTSKKDSYLKELKKNIKPLLKENTAILGLGDDWGSSLNTFYQFSKTDKTVSFKIGCLDQLVYNEADLTRIAQLPSRNELIAKIIGSFKSPMSKFVYSLKYNTNKFVYILKEKSKKTN